MFSLGSRNLCPLNAQRYGINFNELRKASPEQHFSQNFKTQTGIPASAN